VFPLAVLAQAIRKSSAAVLIRSFGAVVEAAKKNSSMSRVPPLSPESRVAASCGNSPESCATVASGPYKDAASGSLVYTKSVFLSAKFSYLSG
jgi:hypothetical protein